jgi:hypothetical protein
MARKYQKMTAQATPNQIGATMNQALAKSNISRIRSPE